MDVSLAFVCVGLYYYVYTESVNLELARSCHGFQVDLLVAGFPCKSVSTLTNTPGSVLDKDCTSGHGFLAVHAYAKKHRPPLILMENVGSLFSRREVEGGVSAHLDFQTEVQ